MRESPTPLDGYLVPQPERLRLNGNVARRRPQADEVTLWDADLAGFGLRIQPSGHRSWIVKFLRRGRQKKVTLGAVGDLSADQARRKARAILAQAATDGLPTIARPKTAPSFNEYAEIFWADYARHWKPATQVTNRGAIERNLKPVFGNLLVDQIRRSDVLRWRDDMCCKPGLFNRVLPVLACMLAYAEQLGYRPRNSSPCRRMPGYPKGAKERFLSSGEFRRLGRALAEFDSEWPNVVAIIRLLMLTGARVSEILTLRWDAVHPPRLRLVDSKTGPKYIYLGRAASGLLAKVEGKDGFPWVFPGPKGDGPIKTISPQWRSIRRAAALPDVRLHDLRHSYASVAINRGISLMMIGRLLGHALPETTARYAHLEDQSIVEAAARVSRSIGQATGLFS